MTGIRSTRAGRPGGQHEGGRLHIVFATILVGSLAAKEYAADAVVEVDNAELETGVTRVAQSQGRAFRGDAAIGASVRALAFEAPGCARPVVVVFRVTFDYEPLLRSAREQGDVLRYVYIDRSWEKPDRLAVFIERMKYAALATFGVTRYVPSAYMLVVDSPSPCQTADAVDWRNVWNRDCVAQAPLALPKRRPDRSERRVASDRHGRARP